MADRKTRQRGLGRGLSALMSDVTEGGNSAEHAEPSQRRPDMMAPIERISPNPEQPRRSFEQEQLEDLAKSIREKGVIQPLIVRPRPGHEDEFEIVAGERRWRAAQIAQQHEVPVIVRDFDDTEVLEVAIIENIQRADLNPIEEAAGFSQLMNRFGHTQEKLADVLGKSRSHIANSVRLLHLPEEVQDFLRQGKLSAGHARALVTADDPASLARRVIKKGLSVRETEKMAKDGVGNVFTETGKSDAGAGKPSKDADTKALEGDLSANLGMKVAVDHKPEKESGQIRISYATLDELDTLCRLLSGQRE
ncbi:chromosome partitioning protein ParB [Roseovarius sp. TE539]|uniref:ParB/RepB/Spo0J family partition protein n=1 Tax=Roseovarius sp. TE539 TaxID=2249812 RepID=UPI000DDCC1C6|nr:ParB/RepB/Spo0J family partition protein [Roseovarius sp. TE539]RBI77624.1 chromosome partitioning protein ParB [Roseovarius sp. TE539]